MAFDRQKTGRGELDQDQPWGMSDPQALELARYQDGEKLDIPRLMAVAREFSKALAIFRPPEGYSPEPVTPEPTLTSSMARALGAPTLTEYFRRTLKIKDPRRDLTVVRGVVPLPRGPESVPGALLAIEEALAGYQALDREAYKKVIGELSAIRASLLRAQSLGAELAILADRWRLDGLWRSHKAIKLAEAARLLTVNQEMGSVETGQALTDLTQNLLETLAETRSSLLAQRRWRLAARQVIEEIDSLKARLFEDNDAGLGDGLDWPGQLKNLEARLGELETRGQALSSRRQETDRRLTEALSELERTESSLVGEANTMALKRGETLRVSVEALLKSTVAQRFELAETWWRLPQLVGRPTLLENIYLETAIHLGKAQGLLEELKSRLSRLAARLSSSRELRLAARQALAMEKEKAYPATLREAHRRLADLKNLRKKEKNSPLAEADLSHPLASQDSPALSALAEQLSAVALERDRLKEELLGLKDRLVESGQFKAKLMKMVEWARRALKEVTLERGSLLKSLTDNDDALALTRRQLDSMAESHRRVLAEYDQLVNSAYERDDQMGQVLVERQALAQQLTAQKTHLRLLEKEKEVLTAKGQELARSLEQARGQEAALTAELSGHQEELAEATRARERLGLIITGYRGQLDQLVVAHQALLDAWKRRGVALAQSEREKEDQKILLAKRKRALISQVTQRHKLLAELGASRGRLESLETERSRLNKEIEGARAEAERARTDSENAWALAREAREETAKVKGEFELARDEMADRQRQAQIDLATAEETEKRLRDELANLRKEMDLSLKPLIEILGLALWRGEASARRAIDAERDNLAQREKESAAREAGIRIQGAGREIELLERISRRDTELESARAEIESLEMERGAFLESQKNEDQEKGWVVNQLSVALAASDLRHERLNRGLRDLKARFSSQKAEAISVKAEMAEIIKNQAQALKHHKAWLSELVPLVAFFLDSGLDYWTQPTTQDDARQAVLYFLKEENVALAAELERSREERQGLWSERQSLLATQAGFKKRLLDLRSLIGFLLRQFVDNAVSLAQAWTQRDTLLAQIATLHASLKGSSSVASEESEADQDSQAKQSLTDLTTKVDALKDLLDRATDELERQRENAATLGRDKELTEERVVSQESEIQRLTAAEKELGAKFQEVQTEAKRLAVDNRRLMSVADRQAEELAKRSSELEALALSPRPDGQLAAAWGALNYLGARSADSLETMRTRLQNEARRVEELRNQLSAKEETIKILEGRQDTLAILYWTVTQMAADGQLALPDSALKALPNLDELEEPRERKDREDQGKDGEQADKKTSKGLLSGGLLAEIRKAARKSLFSLILAGGLVVYLPTPGESKPLLLGGPRTPMLNVEKTSFVKPNVVEPNVGMPSVVRTVEAKSSDKIINAEPVAFDKNNARPGAVDLVAPRSAKLGQFGSSQSSARPRSLGQGEPPDGVNRGPAFHHPVTGRGLGLRPLGHFSGEDRWESSSDQDNLGPANRVHCRSLGRVIDLGSWRLEDRLGVDIEGKALDFLTHQAKKWGISVGAFIRLTRAAYDKDKTVFLADLSGEDTAINLCRPYLPEMVRALRRCEFKEVLGRYLLPHLDGLPKLVAEFWDRLFMDFYHRTTDPQEAALGLAWHLSRRSDKRLNLEYAGVLSPTKELEQLTADKGAPILADYIRTRWPGVSRRNGQDREAQRIKRFAADLWAVGGIMGAPWTFLAVVAHRNREKGVPWPTTLEVYGWAKTVAENLAQVSRKWSMSRAPLCDLDLLAEAWSEGLSQNLIKKNKDLVNYFARAISQPDGLFEDEAMFGDHGGDNH
ncbi:MAG: hypothetical protein LBT86_02620 [Deltaproteobacteria bacterium]|jgi:chromosome segregation ATPase|nr:hypothetical protein [Deltaproteobacteria bacterium]